MNQESRNQGIRGAQAASLLVSAVAETSFISDNGVIEYIRKMSLAEIKDAVCERSPKELTELAAFVYEKDNAVWDDKSKEMLRVGSSTCFSRRERVTPA